MIIFIIKPVYAALKKASAVIYHISTENALTARHGTINREKKKKANINHDELDSAVRPVVGGIVERKIKCGALSVTMFRGC